MKKNSTILNDATIIAFVETVNDYSKIQNAFADKENKKLSIVFEKDPDVGDLNDIMKILDNNDVYHDLFNAKGTLDTPKNRTLTIPLLSVDFDFKEYYRKGGNINNDNNFEYSIGGL